MNINWMKVNQSEVIEWCSATSRSGVIKSSYQSSHVGALSLTEEQPYGNRNVWIIEVIKDKDRFMNMRKRETDSGRERERERER